MKSFQGEAKLKEKYYEIIKDLPGIYTKGMSLCFAGLHGVGKSSVVTNIIKTSTLKGYSGLYTTLSDIVSTMLSKEESEKYIARRELTTVDFLVIDEFDSRFMPTDNASDLFGRTLENIFRTRSQNRLPTFMCTNSPNVVETFSGPIKQSIDSLMKGYVKVVPVFGEDFRKTMHNKK